jgi:hypothetical protein
MTQLLDEILSFKICTRKNGRAARFGNNGRRNRESTGAAGGS